MGKGVPFRSLIKSRLLMHLGRPLAHFGLPFGSLWLPLGSLWAPFGSLWLPLGSLWRPFGSLLAPFGSLWPLLALTFLRLHFLFSIIFLNFCSFPLLLVEV